MLSIPMVSAIMQSVSNDTLAVALAQAGGLSFIYGSQSVADEALEVLSRLTTWTMTCRGSRLTIVIM